jgi:hypothetical protein
MTRAQAEKLGWVFSETTPARDSFDGTGRAIRVFARASARKKAPSEFKRGPLSNVDFLAEDEDEKTVEAKLLRQLEEWERQRAARKPSGAVSVR